MKYITLVCILFICSCKQDKKAPEPMGQKVQQDTLRAYSEDPNEMTPVHNIAEIKTLLWADFEKHKNDPVYERFSMFTTKAGGSLFQAEIKIGPLFHESQQAAILGWSLSDSTMEIAVFIQQNAQWQSVFSASNIPSKKSGGTAMREPFLIINDDYNEDGWADLEVMIDAWDGIGTGYRSMLWLVKNTQFKPVKHFEDIASPEPDGGFVYSYMSGGCADMAMHFSVWKIQNNLARMITETAVNCCVEEGEKCLVSKNKGKEMAVPADKVYLHVPDFYKEAVKSKMEME